MEKTLFAGLTVLDQDESILTDGGSFIGRDRRLIDRLLEIGAKTHRHDGTSGLGDPMQAIGASATGSAGQLPGDLTFSVGYTLEDDQLGETLISPLTTISTPPVLPRPAVAPTAVADYSAGTLLTDTYYYAISYTDAAGGETPIGPAQSVEREPGFANGRILLTGLDDGMVAAGAAGWRLYRAVGGGDFHFLAAGTGDGYTDNGGTPVQPDITPLAESENSTNSDNGLLLHLPSADGLISDATFINVYLSEDGSFSGNSFLEQFPVASAGRDAFYPTVTLENSQPPYTNNSIGGASLIDPDRELLDWHWLRPVQLASQLGSGVKGDVRLVHGASAAYYLPNDGAGSADWSILQGGGGGGGGSLDVSDGTDTVVAPPTLEFDSAFFDVVDFMPDGAFVTFVGGGGGGVGARTSYNYTTGSLADGTDEQGSLDTAGGVGNSMMTIWDIDDGGNAARVRIYADAAAQSADNARTFGTDPTGDHGVLLDVETGGAPMRINPAAIAYTTDGTTTFYITVENQSGSTTTVSIDIYAVPMAG